MSITRLNAALSGRYRIEREIGQGGMATVYLADDLKHGRTVALKVLKPQLAALVGAERFLAEITTTANLQHPNILPLFDSGEADHVRRPEHTAGVLARRDPSCLQFPTRGLRRTNESLREELRR